VLRGGGYLCETNVLRARRLGGEREGDPRGSTGFNYRRSLSLAQRQAALVGGSFEPPTACRWDTPYHLPSVPGFGKSNPTDTHIHTFFFLGLTTSPPQRIQHKPGAGAVGEGNGGCAAAAAIPLALDDQAGSSRQQCANTSQKRCVRAYDVRC
jgi:hypothetical protein